MEPIPGGFAPPGLPDQADRSDYYDWKELFDGFRDTKAERIVIVVDACYAGGLQFWLDQGFSDIPEELKARFDIVASSDAFQRSAGGDGGGVFTTNFIKALRESDLCIDKAFERLPSDLQTVNEHLSWPQNPTYGKGPGACIQDRVGGTKDKIARVIASDEQPDITGSRGITVQKSGRASGAVDPNDKVPYGVGPEGWIRPDERLHFTINFENIAPEGVPPEYILPAQEVIVTDQLSEKLDWSTLEFGSIGFGSSVVTIPAGVTSWTTSARTPNDENPVRVSVDVGCGFGYGHVAVAVL